MNTSEIDLDARTRGRLPLRWRIAVAFALASVFVTGLLALITWSLASDYMLDQRQGSAQLQFSANARLVSAYLRRHQSTALGQALLELEYDQDDIVALRANGRWYTDGPFTDPRELNSLAAQLTGHPERTSSPQHRTVDHRPVLATATAIPAQNTLYMELATLDDLDQSLRFIKAVLIAGVGASLLLGLVLGRWAGWQALRPLINLTATAARVASGDLRARLPEQSDADLAPLALTFNRTASALEERVARDARFATDVSHELRSPLTTMINAVAVLNRRRDELSDTARHALRLLTADLERFQRMVIDLLEIARDDQLPTQEELETCDLAQLVGHTLDARHERAALEVGKPPPLVLAERRRLDQVVANLLDNAARHAGGAVRVAVFQEQGRARLEVDDAGPGVPAEFRDQVFERFTRGNRSGARGNTSGSGLGLALVAQHVRRHSGRVWVEDRPGGGARFVVDLPLLATGDDGAGQISDRGPRRDNLGGSAASHPAAQSESADREVGTGAIERSGTALG